MMSLRARSLLFFFVLLLLLYAVDVSQVDALVGHHRAMMMVGPPLLSPSTTTWSSLMVAQSDQQGYIMPISHREKDDDDDDFFSAAPCIPTSRNQRRSLLHKALVTATTAASAVIVLQQSSSSLSLHTMLHQPQAAWASGGATAGRYTTIPIAKRRYYGRVQQAVHEFVGMAADVKRTQDMSSSSTASNKFQAFFDPTGTVIVPSKRTTDVNGQCTKKDGDCRGKEIRDSRWNDMKASMYLLANAFRTDQQKPPDRLPTVKAARAFFAKVDAMEKSVKKSSSMKAKQEDANAAVVQLYVEALDILDAYLDLVELPPIDSGHYEQEFNTLVGETARIT
jgi:hypothetical protein